MALMISVSRTSGGIGRAIGHLLGIQSPAGYAIVLISAFSAPTAGTYAFRQN
jgi:hypothetical protein